jgi:DNA primase
MRVESDKRTRNGGYLHALSEPLPIQTFRPATPAVERASVAHVHAVYGSLLRSHLVLAEEHRERLRSRGLSDAEIECNGYRSTPTDAYSSNFARFLSPHGLKGVPGFYRDGSWKMVNAGKGFLIPVRDSRLRIRGFQVRRDEGTPKYVWLSSNGRIQGSSPGSPVHFSHPERIREQKTAVITEGALKADVISSLLNCGVIAFGGVNFPNGFGSKLKKVFPEIKGVSIAFDSDFRENEAVNRALFRLLGELRLAGIHSSVLTWNPEYKGMDDYLLRKAA